jgi:ABC-type transport system involved in cytochrome bd biosynthesis fused ATPase/permease subunit
MDSSDKNPAKATFDKYHRISVPLIVLVAGLIAIWRNDLSAAFLPVTLAAATIYMLMVFLWRKIFRTLGAKLSKRNRDF